MIELFHTALRKTTRALSRNPPEGLDKYAVLNAPCYIKRWMKIISECLENGGRCLLGRAGDA